MKINELHNQPVQADTYEASMALNQLLKIGNHAVKLHNMIDDSAEMEAWVAKKIDLAGDYVKKVHGYMQGEKAGLYDNGGMTEIKKMPKGTGTMQGVKESREQIGDYAREIKSGRIVKIVDYTDDDEGIYTISYGDNKGENDVTAKDLKFLDQTGGDQEEIGKFDEDAGEGHMSKSTLYHTAKYAIELMDMIKPGDDLEGWVQSKLNKAADYLQGTYNYEEYQKLNPYREELDKSTLHKHSQVIQKHIDEILARETSLDDVDTKPGMMRILNKRVNEVEKELAKENRKQTNEAPPGMGTIGKAATKVGSKILSKIPGMGQKAADLDSKLQGDEQIKGVYKKFRDFAVKTGAKADKPQASTVSAFLKQMGLQPTSELQGLQGDPMVSPKTLNTILTKATQDKVRGAPAPKQQAPAGKGMSPDIKKVIGGLTPQQKTQLAKML